MWSKIKQFFLFNFFWPLYITVRYFTRQEKLPSRIVKPVILDYNKYMKEVEALRNQVALLSVRTTWPYEDETYEEEGQQKIVYANTGIELESRLSRKFRQRRKI